MSPPAEFGGYRLSCRFIFTDGTASPGGILADAQPVCWSFDIKSYPVDRCRLTLVL